MLTSEEKRALEIYTFLILAEIRKDNSKALIHIQQFFKSMSFFRNYNPDFLYTVCINNLENIQMLPTPIEMSLLFDIKSTQIKFNKKNLKKIYHKPISTAIIRSNMFSEHPIKLYPKIREPDFHENLLIFYQNFGILNKTNPVLYTL